MLLSPVAVLAQEEDGQAQTAATPDGEARQVEILRGVPEDFSLPARPDESRRNRMEPMVQPLPQPSATPTEAPVDQAEASREAIPAPQIPAVPESEPREASAPPPPRETEVPRSARETLDGAEQDELPAEQPQPDLQPDTPTTVTEAPPAHAEETADSGNLIAWLLGGALLAALAALAVWFLRRRNGTSLVVEKIEPYRPPPSPAENALRREPEAKEKPVSPPGIVHASRSAPAVNPGGFVTSSIVTRKGQQAPRRYTSADGRIVTSLSRGGD